MTVKIQEVESKQDFKQFVNFVYKHYQGSENWIPPIKNDELFSVNKEKNPAYEFCESKFWLAYEGNKIVGRIGALINFVYNKKVGEKLGRIHRPEFIDDTNVSKALFEVAEKWLREKGMEKVHGPLGFTNIDQQGLLIEGFDTLPSIASVYNHDYYQKHFENLGYGKENDWLEFKLTVGEEATKKASRGASLVKRRYGFESLSFTKSSELKEYTHVIFEILNNAFKVLPYTVPFTDKMIEASAKKYFSILNPKYVKIIKKDDEVIGFFVGLPSLSKAMKKANGSVLPFGILPIMKALKHPQVIDMLLTGVKEEYQNTGAAVILMAELQEQMLKEGINQIETTGIFEINNNAISNWKNYEHIQHKRRRCFVKNL
jgi:hypothetical protein